MTGPELRALLKQLDLRQVGLAERLGVSPVTVYRWLSGDLAVPQYVVAYLELKLSLEAMGTLTKFITLTFASDPLPPTMTVSRFVATSGLSTRTVHYLLERGELESVLIGKRRLIITESHLNMLRRAADGG